MALRALMLAHEAEYGKDIAGHVGAELEVRGYELSFHGILELDGSINLSFPEASDFDLIVVFGSFHHAYSKDDQHWLEPERQWIAGIQQANIPYLGICFGAQLLAQVIGGSVQPSPAVEAGVITVDAVPDCPIPAGPWFTWHGDCMSLPESATILGSTEIGPQIFTIGRSVGVQFHPEATPELVASWLAVGGDDLPAPHTPEAVFEATAAAAAATKANCIALLDVVTSGIAEA